MLQLASQIQLLLKEKMVFTLAQTMLLQLFFSTSTTVTSNPSTRTATQAAEKTTPQGIYIVL